MSVLSENVLTVYNVIRVKMGAGDPAVKPPQPKPCPSVLGSAKEKAPVVMSKARVTLAKITKIAPEKPPLMPLLLAAKIDDKLCPVVLPDNTKPLPLLDVAAPLCDEDDTLKAPKPVNEPGAFAMACGVGILMAGGVMLARGGRATLPVYR